MIIGNNIKIRAIKEKDLSDLFSMLGDFESKGEFLPIEIQSEVKFRKEYEVSGFVTEKASRYVLVSNSDEIIGLIWAFISVPYFDALEIGYQIFDEKNRNKGYATEAVNAFVNHLFESKQLNRIEIRIAVGNSASEKIAQKNGFTHEGISRQAAYSKGTHHDMHIFSKLRSEWRS
ncbi:MAG: GNAT family protein [Candidatus Sedimenticola sp. (ex Thyasira tokunagai)]